MTALFYRAKALSPIALVSYWAFLLATPPARAADPPPERFSFESQQMGTTFRIDLYARDRATAGKLTRACFERVELLNAVMSDYDGSSELMRLCRRSKDQPAGPVKVSPELFAVLSQAQQISALSDGAFDITVGPVVRLWRFSRRNEKLPREDELKEALSRVGYRKLRLDEAGQTADLTVAGMVLDLGGIAKGYAADECLKLLRAGGIGTALVAASGDIAAMGTPPDSPRGWAVAIEPLPGSTAQRTIWLKDQAVSTSGDARQFVVIDGKRYSHIVDPKTGLGLTGRRSVTIVAPRGLDSDPLTKLASVLPPEKSLPILEKLRGVEACVVWRLDDKEEVTTTSKGFAKLLKAAE